MAQWLGQFTGHTHATKVADREEMLRAAIARCSTAGSEEATPPNLVPLARRVIEARLKCMRAQLSDLREPRPGALPQKQIDRLEQQIRELESGDIAAILMEFRCPPHIIVATIQAQT